MEKILITGARSGIAKEVIDKIKDNNNYYIYLTVHTTSQLQETKKIYNDYTNIKCLKLDITNKLDKEKIKDLDIDILINHAAIGYGGSICDIDMNKVRENYEVNVFSSFELLQIIIKNMIKNNKGKIIITSSIASIIPIPFIGIYASTKSSINMLATTLRKELKLINKNIKIILIQPGIYKTGFNEVMLDNKYPKIKESYFKNRIKTIKLREYILFNLLSKKNYNSITNKIIKSIKTKHPKKIYRAPLLQSIITKIYQIFN